MKNNSIKFRFSYNLELYEWICGETLENLLRLKSKDFEVKMLVIK